MSNIINISQILIKRGNTIAANTYVGPLGELLVDTGLQTLRLQDGSTPGGMSTLVNTQQLANVIVAVEGIQSNTANISALVANIHGANISGITSNVALLQHELSANGIATIGGLIVGNIGFTSNSYIWSVEDSQIQFSANGYNDQSGIFLNNQNVAVMYANTELQLISGSTGSGETWVFDQYGNLTLPGNVIFADSTVQSTAWNGRVSSLVNGSQTLQLAANGTVTMPDGVTYNNATLKSQPGQALTLENSTGTQTVSVNDVFSVITANSHSWAFNSDAGLIFPDHTYQYSAYQGPAGQTSFASNAYVTTQINNLINSAPGTLDTLGQIAANLATEAGAIGGIISSITSVNANVTAANAAIITANSAVVSYVNAQDSAINTAWSANLAAANIAWQANATTQQSLIATLQTQVYANANVAAYLPTYTGSLINSNSIQTINTEINGIYSNNAGLYNSILGANSSIQTLSANVGTFYTWANANYSNYSNVNVSAYLAGNVTIGNVTSTYFIGNGSKLTSVTAQYLGATQVTGGYTSGTNTGYLTVGPNGLVQSSAYALTLSTPNTYPGSNNINISPGTGGNVVLQGNIVAAGNIYYGSSFNATANVTSPNFLYPNGVSILTGISGTYSNTQVAAYLLGNISTGNVGVASGSWVDFRNTDVNWRMGYGINAYSKTTAITSLDVVVGQGSGGPDGFTVGQTGGVSIFELVGYTKNAWFANNITAVGNVTAGNVLAAGFFYANGTPFTSSSYGNTQVAAYLVANPQSGTYSNTNVASYLTTATISTTGNITAGNLTTSGTYTVANITTTGAYGNITGANVISANTVQASSFNYANGVSILSGISGGTYSNTNVASYISATTFSAISSSVLNSVGQINGTLVYIQTNGSHNFLFDSSGNLVLPTGGAINYANGASILTGITSGGTTYSNANVIANLQNLTTNVATTANVQANYFVGNGSALTGLTYNNVGNIYGTSSNVTLQAGSYSWTFDNTGNLTIPTTGNIIYANGTVFTSGSGGSGTYSNTNVVSMLAANTSVFIGNVGNVSVPSVYPLQSNITQLFIGGNTALTSGNAAAQNSTFLMYNGYFAANGAIVARNTTTGLGYMVIDSTGIGFNGYTGAVTANTAPTFNQFLKMNGSIGAVFSGAVTAVGLTSTSTVAVNAATGITTSSTSFPLVNTTATSVQFAGAATTTTIGASNGITVFGANTGAISAGTIIVNTNFITNGNVTANAGGSVVSTGNSYTTGNTYTQYLVTTGNSMGNISGVNNLTAVTIQTTGTYGNITGANVVSANTFVASGNITAANIVANQFGNSIGTTATYTGNVTASSVIASGSSGPQTRFLWDTWQANSTLALSSFTPSGTIGGNATWDSTQAYGLKLTTTTTSQSGYINWNSATINYNYDMVITASIGASGGTGADGQWIYFGSNAAITGNPGNTNTYGGIAVMNHYYSSASQFEVYVGGTQTNIPYIGNGNYVTSGVTLWNASYTSFYNLTLKIRKIQNGNRMLEVYLNEIYQGSVNIGSWAPSGNYYGVAAYTGGSTAQNWVRQLRIDW